MRRAFAVGRRCRTDHKSAGREPASAKAPRVRIKRNHDRLFRAALQGNRADFDVIAAQTIQSDIDGTFFFSDLKPGQVRNCGTDLRNHARGELIATQDQARRRGPVGVDQHFHQIVGAGNSQRAN
jgi:hypothetical protein